MARMYVTLGCRWSIAHENDSGKWLLILHVTMDGKEISAHPFHWFSRKEDAEEILWRIAG